MSKLGLQSFLSDFAADHEFDDEASDQTKFEHLCSWLLLRDAIADPYDPGEYVSSEGETGIDGGCIALNGAPIATDEDCDAILSKVPSASVDLHIVFFQSKLTESVAATDILNFANATKDLLSVKGALPQDSFLDGLRSAVQSIRLKYLSKLRSLRCSLFFCTVSGSINRTSHQEQAVNRMREDIVALGFFDQNRVDVFDFRYPELVARWRETSTFARCELPYDERVLLSTSPGISDALIARVNARNFVDKVLRTAKGELRPGVFDRNVRAYLGDDNSVNADMMETLKNPQKRALFALMNNGITIVARSLSDRARTLLLDGYQIVNGGQTSNVLHRCHHYLDATVEILVRVVVADSWAVLDDVIRATNSQTSIPIHQLAANSDKLVEIAHYFEGHEDRERLHLERRTAQFDGQGDIRNARTFPIPLLAQCFATVYLEKPHRVSSAPNSTFEELSADLFRPEHSPRLYYAAAWGYYMLRNCIKNQGFRVGPMRIYWHVLLCARMLVEPSLPSLTADPARAGKSADRFFEATRTTAAALELFQKALRIVQQHLKHGVGPRSAALVQNYRQATRQPPAAKKWKLRVRSPK